MVTVHRLLRRNGSRIRLQYSITETGSPHDHGFPALELRGKLIPVKGVQLRFIGGCVFALLALE